LKTKHYLNSEYILFQDNDFLVNQRIAGRVVSTCLSSLRELVNQKTKLTTLELSRFAEDIILKNNCTPTFKNYKGFPEAVCISINKELVHGIPKDYFLQEGDLVSFDLGATYKEAIADAAITVIYGEPKHKEHLKLIEATEVAIHKAIDVIKVDRKIGVIGEAISKCARGYGLSVVNQYGGHGITIKDSKGIPHAEPFIANKSSSTEGIRIQPGMTIAIEPLFVLGSSNETIKEKDGWTVSTKMISSHHELTLFIHEESVEIITKGSI
jgi:methionyl aminopeptidase